jgi:hypothetical protein
MAESPGTSTSRRDDSESKASLISRLRDFVTSTAGIATGLATIVTAIATIAGVLSLGGRQPRHAVTQSSTIGGTVSPSVTTSSVSSVAARIQWGPGDLLITNDGTSLSSVPPGNGEGTVGDIYVGGSGFSPFAGTTLVLWRSSTSPTPQQCKYLAVTQGDPGQSVNVVSGSVVCAVTSEGPIAIMRVMSVDLPNYTIETKTTVWDLP